MRAADKSYLLELYAIHEELAQAVVRANVQVVHGGDLPGTLAHADDLSWKLEEKFGEALTLEERGKDFQV